MTKKQLVFGLRSLSVAVRHAFGPKGLDDMLRANLTNVDSLATGFSPR